MKKAQVFFKQVQKNACLAVFFRVISVLKVNFCSLNIPVAKFIPEIFHNCACRIVIAVAFKRLADSFYRPVQASVYPFIKFSQI